MKKIIGLLSLAILFLAAPVWAADLTWDDPGEGWDVIDGYRVYYTDGVEAYHDNIDMDDLVREAGLVTYLNIDDKLNLHHNVEYDIHITAYNLDGESGPSNVVTYTREGYVPPVPHRPAAVESSPGAPSGLRL